MRESFSNPVAHRPTGKLPMPPPFCYDYPRPQVTVDLVVFCFFDKGIRVLLIRRGREPFAGKWAIPGGFLEMDEPVETAARRELKEETGLEIAGPIEPIGFFADLGRDPRGRTITLAHAAIVPSGEHAVKGADDAVEAAWIKLSDPIDLAFDHAKIVARAAAWLRQGFVEEDLAFQLLPGIFPGRDIRACYRALGLPDRQVKQWVDRMQRAGKLRALGLPGHQFQLVDPAS
jgi:8-oxo-dGTP diphosphatase